MSLASIVFFSTAYGADKLSKENASGYTVQSVNEGRHTTTAFNKKGHWVYTIEQYSLDNLDNNIVELARNYYEDYAVTGIQKVMQPGSDEIYIVRIENTKSFKTLRISNENVELVQDFIKS